MSVCLTHCEHVMVQRVHRANINEYIFALSIWLVAKLQHFSITKSTEKCQILNAGVGLIHLFT